MKHRYRRDPCLSHIRHWMASQGYGCQLDRGEAERFLERLDPKAGIFSFRTFSDTEYTREGAGDPMEMAIHGALDACWEQLESLNRRGAVISVTINRTKGAGRGAADIDRVRALFLDDDRGGDPTRFPLEPHIQVETSPGRYHYYWLVLNFPMQHFKSFQRQLAKVYHGDSRVQALNQSMQLPGFWRRKRVTEPRLARLLVVREHDSYPYDELVRLVN